MIQANELRVGNIVANNQRNGEYCAIESIHRYYKEWFHVSELDSGYCYEALRSELLPIPLTPEIMEKCGLKRTGNLASTTARKFYEIGNGKIVIELIANNRIAVYVDSPTEMILICFKDYLHEFQNLFFALTAEELSINP